MQISLLEKMENNINNTNYAFSVVKSYYEKYGKRTSSYELISAIRNELKGLNLDFKPSEIKEFIRLVDEEFKSSQLHKIIDDNEKRFPNGNDLYIILNADDLDEKWRFFKLITCYNNDDLDEHLINIALGKNTVSPHCCFDIKYEHKTEFGVMHTCLDGSPDMRYKNNFYSYTSTEKIEYVIVTIGLKTGYTAKIKIKGYPRNQINEFKNYLEDTGLL